MRMPSVSMYRGVDIHAFQDQERIDQLVKPAIDAVLEVSDPEELLRLAGDCSQPPEARLLAALRYKAAHSLAADAHGARARFRLELVEAHIAGCDSLGWCAVSHYGSLLDVPPAPGDPGPGPAPRPAEQREMLLAAQDQAGR